MLVFDGRTLLGTQMFHCTPHHPSAVRVGPCYVGHTQEGLPHHATMREVAIHISNHTMHKFDRGVVVVGASTELGDLASRAGSGVRSSRSCDSCCKPAQHSVARSAYPPRA